MSQPPQFPDPGQTPDGNAAPGWPAPVAPPVPDWTVSTPVWQQPVAVPAPQPGPAAGPSAGSFARTRWALAGAGLAGIAAGAVGATLLMTAVVAGTSEDIGRAVAAELAPAIAEGLREGMVEATQESMDAYLGDGSTGWYAEPPGGEVEQFAPVPPEDLGPDEAMDAYALSCFEGDLQSCDDLMYESAPLSAYEEYASTCGGRVKEFTVPACTELE